MRTNGNRLSCGCLPEAFDYCPEGGRLRQAMDASLRALPQGRGEKKAPSAWSEFHEAMGRFQRHIDPTQGDDDAGR